MSEEEETKLTLKPINDLLGEDFFIPAYQRGYRWTNGQVKELLDDIWEFRRNSENVPKEAFYCLQPIVVSKNNGSWEVVDGQQRLTTIYLILDYLKQGLEFFRKGKFSIRYETRPDSAEFLQNIDRDRKEENIDYFHIVEAFEAIENWFKSKDGSAQINFLTTLLNDDESGRNVKVIWYDLSDENTTKDYAIDVFTRINIGKIPLTNAELIKALFLGKIKSNNGDNDRVYLKRLQIASEWDTIENTLQKDDFWYFIYGGNQQYDTRIEYIFDLMKNKPKGAEHYYTFHRFNADFEDKEINDIWLEIKKYFQTFEDWYNDRTFFHYIGFLVETGTSMSELKDAFSVRQTKTEFEGFLLNKIKEKMKFDKYIEDLDYNREKDKQNIRRLLLLFNLQTMLNNSKSNSRFPFDLYKTENWNLEHIRSVQSDEPSDKAKQRNWLEIVFHYFTGVEQDNEQQKRAIENIKNEKEKNLANEILQLLEKDKIPEEEFSRLYQNVLDHFNENNLPESINSLSNLTLLDEETNKYYSNAPFPVKRKTIIERDTKGTFIPLCTKNVFLKAYSNRLANVMYWQEEDERDYLNAIRNTLNEFLPEPESKNE
jgi:uncharacterized protein with ParB-like and HNH nuclease domain